MRGRSVLLMGCAVMALGVFWYAATWDYEDLKLPSPLTEGAERPDPPRDRDRDLPAAGRQQPRQADDGQGGPQTVLKGGQTVDRWLVGL